MATPSIPGRLDPLATEDFDSAHRDLAALRSGCPIAHSEAFGGFYAALDHGVVTEVLKRPRQFITSQQNVVPKVAFTGRRPPLHLDPPEHTPYRQVLNPFFTERRVQQLAPRVRQHVVDLLDPFIEAGGGDLCQVVTRRLPGLVFADLFNLSAEQSMTIKATSEVYNEALQRGDDAAVAETSMQLYELARDIIASRQRAPLDPDDDITSALLAKRVDGEPLPPEMVLGTIRQMIVVGMIAPSVFIGAMAIHLARNHDVQNALRSDLSQVPPAIEEYLRLLTPYRGFARTSTVDTELAGVPIPAGAPIALVYAAANRDPAVFPDPDEFILDRPGIEGHLAFGLGPHRCAGEGLAREMLRATLHELLERTSEILPGDEPQMTRWPEWGTLTAPLVVRKA